MGGGEQGVRPLWWAREGTTQAQRFERSDADAVCPARPAGCSSGEEGSLPRYRGSLRHVECGRRARADVDGTRGDAVGGMDSSAGGARRAAGDAGVRREPHRPRGRPVRFCAPRRPPPLAALVVWLTVLLLQLMRCDGFCGGRSGTSPPPPTLPHHFLRSEHRHAVEPEYVCAYDYATSWGEQRIGAATTYKQYLAQRNSQLREQVLQAGGQVDPTRRSGAGSAEFDRDLALGPRFAPARAPERDEKWRHDVGQRYKELIPPNHPYPSQRTRSKHRMLSVEDLRKAAEAALSTSSSLSWSPHGERKICGREKVAEAVLVLDLDKCSFWGSDANDLGIALQWMEKGPDVVLELYRLLLNPQVKATYARLQERAKKVRVVIYTMRATFLVYASCFRDQTVPLRWDASWHHGAQIFIPPEVRDAETIMRSYSMKAPLLPEERRDLKKSFERLLATRTVLAEELALDGLPELIVTASPKAVETSMRLLGIPVENAYLWDDNVKLRDNPRVVNVPHFDALPPQQHAALMRFLDEHCPAHTLEEDLLDFMLGADPADIVIAEDEETGRFKYQIPMCDEIEEWALPCLVTTTMYHDRAAKGLAGREGMVERLGGRVEGKDEAEAGAIAANGHLSPVTPEYELFAWGGEGGEEAVIYE